MRSFTDNTIERARICAHTRKESVFRDTECAALVAEIDRLAARVKLLEAREIDYEGLLSDVFRVAPGLDARLKGYFLGGGIFNPEMAEHDAVRDLLSDLHDFVRRFPARTP